MDVTHPYLALLPRVPAATLYALHRTAAPMTGREVARRADVSQPAAQSALDRLVDHGLVLLQPAGRANLYALNRDHLAIPAVETIFGMRAALVERIRQKVANWNQVAAHVSLFGSMARGDGDTRSDIDIFIVRPAHPGNASDHPEWRQQISDLERDIEKWTGNRAAPVEVSWEELRSMHQQKSRLLAGVSRDGILVHGLPVHALLRYKVLPTRQMQTAQ